MNSNSSVPCQVLSNVSIIAWLRYYHETVLGLWVLFLLIAIICVDLWHQWHLSISDIFDDCVCNLGHSIILSRFSSRSPFSRALWFVLARMTTPDIGDSDLPNEVCDITNCVTIYYEKDERAGMPSFRKKSSETRFQGKWRHWKLWKKLSRVFTGLLLNMGMSSHFLSLIRGQKQNKTVNRSQKETL